MILLVRPPAKATPLSAAVWSPANGNICMLTIFLFFLLNKVKYFSVGRRPDGGVNYASIKVQ
jgi:hypothetical protein